VLALAIIAFKSATDATPVTNSLIVLIVCRMQTVATFHLILPTELHTTAFSVELKRSLVNSFSQLTDTPSRSSDGEARTTTCCGGRLNLRRIAVCFVSKISIHQVHTISKHNFKIVERQQLKVELHAVSLFLNLMACSKYLLGSIECMIQAIATPIY
jgi:hypothetical protein